LICRKLVGPKAVPDIAGTVKAFAYFAGPHVLDAVCPYLIGGKDLYEPPCDLSTQQGRSEQAIRFAVAVQMLPRDAATDRQLPEIVLLMRELELWRAKTASALPLLLRNLDSCVTKAFANSAPSTADPLPSSPLADILPAIKQAG
jgi:hypothetical protein